MAALRYRARLYKGGGAPFVDMEVNTDPRDYQAARDLLERLVKERFRDLNRDLSKFEAVLDGPGGRVKIGVSSVGETMIDGRREKELTRR